MTKTNSPWLTYKCNKLNSLISTLCDIKFTQMAHMELTKNKQKYVPAQNEWGFSFHSYFACAWEWYAREKKCHRRWSIAFGPNKTRNVGAKKMMQTKKTKHTKFCMEKFDRIGKEPTNASPKRRENKFIQYGNMIGLSKFWHAINNKNQLRWMNIWCVYMCCYVCHKSLPEHKHKCIVVDK